MFHGVTTAFVQIVWHVEHFYPVEGGGIQPRDQQITAERILRQGQLAYQDDSLLNISVTAVVQNTRASVGKQIALMLDALLHGQAVQQLQVLWQPEIGQGETDHPPEVSDSK